VLPIELNIPIWQTLLWDEVRDTKDLLTIKTRQIQRRDKDLEEAAMHLRRCRIQDKEYFDTSHQIRPEKAVNVGNLVLLYDSYGATNMSSLRKLRYRWIGPYKVY